ncbi:hypothetical protein N7509_013979 [Penicillium cosmopolitanum]|uniref:Uncharacterized protein n=1 Tax=Penicillium cosmopolitanum TaxID=1131564 RepID=A0A9W9VCJ3_9EURO|nr:uncharacterized protein N7509_013979 [Penicillium cosmopolitanum]KAJ5377093.1 hypothetical protein N7509_013979 [Penicillium cosmopolitanum]
MNVHYPAWGGPGTWIDQGAEDQLLIMDEQGPQLVRCEGADDLEHASDHFPIRTQLDTETPLDLATTDDKRLVKFIEVHLTSRDLSRAGQMRIELGCQSFIQVIEAAIDVSPPVRNHQSGRPLDSLWNAASPLN